MDKAVIYDGWPIAYMQGSPEASHLETLLAYHPLEVKGILLLPADVSIQLRGDLSMRVVPTVNTDLGRLTWEQKTVPQVGGEIQTGSIHTTSGGVALFSTVPTLYSPAGFSTMISKNILPGSGGLINRLRTSLAQGGTVNQTRILWPGDLPFSGPRLPFSTLPPIVHPAFTRDQLPQKSNAKPERAALPNDYFLYCGGKHLALIHKLLSAWSWVGGPMGDLYHLVILNIREDERKSIQQIIHTYELEENVLAYPSVPAEEEAFIFRSASGLVHLGAISPWGGPIRKALACGIPIVGVEDEQVSQLVGPAAYLVQDEVNEAEISRRLGAAMITLCIEPQIVETQSQAGLKHAEAWQPDRFMAGLSNMYHEI